jgi:hypothetical protein
MSRERKPKGENESGEPKGFVSLVCALRSFTRTPINRIYLS